MIQEIELKYQLCYNKLMNVIDACQLNNVEYYKYSASSNNVYYSESNGVLVKRIDDKYTEYKQILKYKQYNYICARLHQAIFGKTVYFNSSNDQIQNYNMVIWRWS